MLDKPKVNQGSRRMPEIPDQTQMGMENVMLGKYRLVKRLGGGGMGEVYLALDVHLNEPVAVKILHASILYDSNLKENVRNEIKASRVLNHTNIIGIGDYELDASRPYMVMRYVGGGSLQQRITPDGICEDEVRRILGPIAEALDNAHRRRLYHRDIKPANILLDEDGTPYLTDFGISYRMNEMSRLSIGRYSAGTMPYMAPECFSAAKVFANADREDESKSLASIDIFALAVTAYECLTGRLPFGISATATQSAPSPLPSETPLARNIMRGLSRDWRERPASCGEIFALSQKAAVNPISKPDQFSRPDDLIGKAEIPSVGNEAFPFDGHGEAEEDRFLRLYESYRNLLAESSVMHQKNADEATIVDELAAFQVELRTLTEEAERLDEAALIEFFDHVKARRVAYAGTHRMDPYFIEHRRLALWLSRERQAMLHLPIVKALSQSIDTTPPQRRRR